MIGTLIEDPAGTEVVLVRSALRDHVARHTSAMIRRRSLLTKVGQSIAGRLIVVFAFYIVADIGYGGWYFSLYGSDPTRFLFAADMVVAQRAAHGRSVSVDLAENRRATTPFEEFLQSIADKDSSINFSSHFSLDIASAYWELRGHKGAVRFYDGGRADCPRRDRFPCTPFGSVRVLDSQGSTAADIGVDIASLPDPSSAIAARAAIADLTAQLKQRRIKLEAELADSAALTRNAWSFVDFLYFSTITQMTVGYGDIVPNSSIIRLVVMSQLVVNGFFLLVVLNFVLASPLFASPPREPPKK